MDQQPGVACQRRFCALIAPSLKRQKGEAAVKKVIVITGASSGFGALTARRLAEAGHTVYATMRDTGGRKAEQDETARNVAPRKKLEFWQHKQSSLLSQFLIGQDNKLLARRDA